MTIRLPSAGLLATGNQVIKLTAFKDKHIVLYFYPKDNTSGCTKESQDFKSLHNKFKKANAMVFGVSRDNLNSHEKFKQQFEFPFDLISDENEKLCLHFDVIKLKNMYGKKVRGIERSTFLFDKTGKLVKEWRKVKVEGHAKEVLEAVKDLS